MAHVALDALDQVGDEVIPALQLDVDAAPALGHQVLVGHQLVVNRHGPEQQDHHHAQENVSGHIFTSLNLGIHRKYRDEPLDLRNRLFKGNYFAATGLGGIIGQTDSISSTQNAIAL